jgi:hypothetical protein
MPGKAAARRKEARLSGRYLPALVIIAGLAPVVAQGQTNIDEGKTPAQIFSSDCNVCHKSARGLVQGRSAGGITDFLRQHYTASREQAAALAAYILGAGGNDGRKPAVERASRPPEESGRPSNRQVRRPPKGVESPGRAAKLQPPPGDEEEEAKPPADVPISVEEPTRRPRERERPAARPSEKEKPARGRHEPKSTAAKRGRHPAPAEAALPVHETPTASVSGAPSAAEHAAVPSAPPPAASSPSAAAASSPPATAAAPAEPAETVPRDNIPD